MKRAQELRVDEFSAQKLRDSHETIQRLTSQMQEMQEQMNSMNHSGEFQEVESNYSGRLSYVPSQPAHRREKECGKSVSTAMNLSPHVLASSSTAKIPIASKNPGILTARGKSESRMRRNSKPDAASSSQARRQDAYLGGLMDTATWKIVATNEESCDVDLSESDERKEWPHNLHMSPATVPHMETVFSIVRKSTTWVIFLNTTLQAAVHLGQDYEVNLHLWKSLEQLFNETRRLIRDQTEITGMKTIDFKELTWRSISL